MKSARLDWKRARAENKIVSHTIKCRFLLGLVCILFCIFFFVRLCAVLPSIYSLLWLAFYQIKVLHFVMLEMAIGVVCGVEQIGGNRTAVFILLWILFKLNLSANVLEKRTDGEDFRIRIFVGSFLFWSVCLTDDHALFPNAFLHVLIVWFWFLFLYRQRQREINFIHSVCVFFLLFSIWQAITLAKTCESTSEMRECRSPRDWSLLALQNTRTGKSHYLVICRCPDNYNLGQYQLNWIWVSCLLSVYGAYSNGGHHWLHFRSASFNLQRVQWLMTSRHMPACPVFVFSVNMHIAHMSLSNV